jgi:sulfate adenylyltransferase subunit 2
MSLEDESIHILRETAARFDRPVILYSAGKDSSVLAHLARKAFYPVPIPFPFLHVDTGMKFPEMYSFRDRFAQENKVQMIVYRNDKTSGTHPSLVGTQSCCALLKTKALLDALSIHGFDAAIGGARRDEEKSRAKEKIFSFRNQQGQWNVHHQRPELWRLYHLEKQKGEHFRVFPLSNWTELAIWRYIRDENISIAPLYFAKERKVVFRNGHPLLYTPLLSLQKEEHVVNAVCRFRTLGCIPCTGAILSKADTIDKIVEEIARVNYSERTTRVIDHDTASSMEKKKQEGYF